MKVSFGKNPFLVTDRAQNAPSNGISGLNFSANLLVGNAKLCKSTLTYFRLEKENFNYNNLYRQTEFLRIVHPVADLSYYL